jgi:UDP-N-acetylglucosamine/UDP-N-acetylgalactosamine 4-epimerase
VSELTGKRVVVTGGAGFIGSNLCEHLLSHNNQVICIDNVSTGKKSNVEPLFSNPNFSFHEEDITTSKNLAELFTNAHVVFHQAALGSVPRSVHNPLASHEVNATGFLRVLEACKAAGVKRVVYASSSSVYGDSAVLPKSEGQLGNPLSPYAVSKLTNELYASVFSRLYGMECVGLRYFNVFGPKQDPDGEYAAAIPRFILSIRKKQSPVIFGDGEQTRDFTFIENVVQANIKAALAPAHTAGKVYNIAYGKSVTVNQMFMTIRTLLAVHDSSLSNVHSTYAAERPGDVKFSRIRF